MDTQVILTTLGEPTKSHILGHELIEVERKKVAWYRIETTWSKENTKTIKKQRFKFIQEALLRVRDAKERLKLNVQLPMLPLSIVPGTSEVIRAQRTSEFNAFLAASISVPQLRALPSLLQLLAPDDIGSQSFLPEDQPHRFISTSTSPFISGAAPENARSNRTHAESSSKSAHTAADAATGKDVERGAQPGQAPSGTHDMSGAESMKNNDAFQQPGGSNWNFGFNLEQPNSRYPYHGKETALVASSSKIAKLEAVVSRCTAIAHRLGEELATKDATIQYLQEQVARYQEELQRAQAS